MEIETLMWYQVSEISISKKQNILFTPFFTNFKFKLLFVVDTCILLRLMLSCTHITFKVDRYEFSI